MLDQFNTAIDQYMTKWQVLITNRKDPKNKEFFERLRPTALGWKTADLAEFDRLFAELREYCDQIHVVWLNDRWLAAMHLKDNKLSSDITIIKLMQRKPDSSDAIGLDHIDFLDMEETNTKAVLAEESDIKWTDEKNGACKWTSIWFAGTEAKLRQETVFDVAISEFQQISNRARGPKFAVATESTGINTADTE